jgi:hypothetical protein
MKNERCELCRFFWDPDKYPHIDQLPDGVCRRHAPVVSLRDQLNDEGKYLWTSADGIFPPMERTDWCGDFGTMVNP